MKYRLNNQIVLITGGSQGLGRQFAKKYHNESKNTTVVIVSRSKTKLVASINSIINCEEDVDPEDYYLLNSEDESSRQNQKKFSKNRIYYYNCDLSSYASVETLFTELRERELLPTQILACAGGSTPKLFTDLTAMELEQGINMNYKTSLFIAHQASIYTPSCHLILFSSVTAFFPFIGYSQYAPLKGGVKALASILRQELPHMRISVIYPGNFQSEGFEVENSTKPEITKTMEGASVPISCELCCNKIVWWLQYGYDDVTTDFIGWFLMSLDMGLNKHNNKSPLWLLQLIIGAITNLTAVPVHMLICSFQIKSWTKKQSLKPKDM